MSKLIFTPEQIKLLPKKQYVENVSEKNITYSDEFKRHFVSESLDNKTTKQLFSVSGLEPAVIGENRMKSFSKKGRKRYREKAILSLKDARKESSGRPRKNVLIPEPHVEKLQNSIALLEQENDLLKKAEWQERRQERNAKSGDVFARTHTIKTNGLYKGTVGDACDALGGSKSGYYNHLKNLEKRQAREKMD